MSKCIYCGKALGESNDLAMKHAGECLAMNNPDPPTESENEQCNPPSWACSQWGQYERDWLDCPQCLASYEKELESEPPLLYEEVDSAAITNDTGGDVSGG